MHPPVQTFAPLPTRIRGDRVREARARHETADWQAWPDADDFMQPVATGDDRRQDES